MIAREASPFDELAGDYDERELQNPIRQLMRARSLSLLEETFPSGAKLLDVGCGTGTEAISLAKRGCILTAIDSSPHMLEVLSARARAAGVSIRPRLLKAGELSALSGEGAFDGAYSSFGALNTEASIGEPIKGLARLVRPGGRIVLSVMNRWCVSEMALLLARGRPGPAFRRLRPSLNVTVGSTSVEVRYPSWRQMRQALQQDFRVLRVQALPLFLLPYAWPALAGHRRLYHLVARLDRFLAPHRPWAWLGDHLLVVAERRADT